MNRIISIIVVIMLSSAFVDKAQAQNRGNVLSFQGIEKAFAFTPGTLGSGYDGVADLGGTASIFFNPAGISGMEGITVSAGFGSIENTWWENQNYRPNRRMVTMPYYLEGLYTPDPANNGRLDSDVFVESLLDTSYTILNPEMGVEHFSEEAADWKWDESASGLSHISIAVPFQLSGKQVTLSGGYGSLINGTSYDFNRTYLTPHPAYLEYGMPAVVDGSDTVRIDWYTFERLQRLKIDQVSLGLGIQATDNIHVGLGMNVYSGSSEDIQVQDKVGYFDLIDQNEYIWSYDTLNTHYAGDATYSGNSLKLGLILDYDHFRFGASFNSSVNLTKEWTYAQEITYLQGDTLLSTRTASFEGQDELKIPASYAVGVQLMPVEKFTFLLSYQVNPYGSAELTEAEDSPFSAGDSLMWVDQSVIQFGMSYAILKNLKLNALYRSIPQVYVPDGAPLKSAGPAAVAYRLGTELDLGMLGALDLGFEYQDLKYQDIYYSNTNYAREQARSVTLSYIYSIK